MFNWKQLKKSFKYAFNGLKYVYKSEQNFRIQILVALVIIIFGLFFGIRVQEWIVVLMLIALILILEILNTVLETFIDILKPKIHHYVQIVKDLMAGMVLLASLIAIVVGVLIFYPYINKLF